MYCKANFKSVAKCKKRLCTAVFALFKKNTRRVAWPVLQSRCKALSALSQNTLKNTKTGRKSVGFLILTQAPKCTRSHCFPPQKHPKNGFVMRFAGKNSFFQLRARDFSFYMNAYNNMGTEDYSTYEEHFGRPYVSMVVLSELANNYLMDNAVNA